MKVKGYQKLPLSWRQMALGECCSIRMGETLIAKDLTGEGTPVFSANTSAEPWGYTSHGRLSFDETSIVVGARGSVGSPRWPKLPHWTSTQTTIILTTNDIFTLTPEWLYYALISIDYKKITSQQAIPMITVADMRSTLIPIPPHSEQKRIAAILSEKMKAFEKAQTASEERLRAARELLAAYLREVFEREGAKEWPRKKVRDILSSPLNTGISKPASPSSDIDCLTLSSVRNGLLDLNARKSVAVTSKEAEKNWVKPGAFYVVRGNGNLSLVGRGALAPDPLELKVLYPDLLIEVNSDPQMVISEYLNVVWNTDEVRSQIEGVARTSAGIHKINLQNLGNISIPAPGVDLQAKIVDDIFTRTNETSLLVDKICDEMMTVNLLPTALLRQAFAGEL